MDGWMNSFVKVPLTSTTECFSIMLITYLDVTENNTAFLKLKTN